MALSEQAGVLGSGTVGLRLRSWDTCRKYSPTLRAISPKTPKSKRHARLKRPLFLVEGLASCPSLVSRLSGSGMPKQQPEKQVWFRGTNKAFIDTCNQSSTLDEQAAFALRLSRELLRNFEAAYSLAI